MNVFQPCRNTSDAVPLYLPQDLYLKPIARIHISVQLPHQIEAGKSISNWEIMEKLRAIIKPEEFCILKVAKTALEFIRFEAEIENKAQLFRIIAMVDGRTIKLSTFSQSVKVRASEAKSEFPNRHAWDSFFRDAKNMNEMKPGERPDTIHITNLPIKWFIPAQHANKDGLKPSQKVFQRVFEKFGHIRCVDIPICDPYRSKMKEHITGMKTFTFDQGVLFEGYVQFQDYIGFSQTMDAFRGMKLLRKDNDDAYTININVDFDKTKHLTDVTIRRRQIVRDRLMARDQKNTDKEQDELNQLSKEEEEKRQQALAEKEAKERRQSAREERRKARHFAKLKLKETEELRNKIVKEKKKLKKVERKLQAIRLVEQLFERIKTKKEKDEAIVKDIQNNSSTEISKLKSMREKQVKEQQIKLQKALEGRVVLDSILGGNSSSGSSSDSDSESKHKHKKGKKKKKKKSKSHKGEKNDAKIKKESDLSTPNMHNPYLMTNPNWMGYMPPNGMYPFQPMFRPRQPMMPQYYQYPPMLRGHNNGIIQGPGPSRGQYPRSRGNWSRNWRGKRGSMMPHYTPELENEYYKYFRKFLDDDRERRSNSRSSRSRSSSRNRSRRRSDNRRRSRSRSSNRSRRRSRSRSRRSRSRSKSSRSRSRSRSRSSSRSRSRSRSRNRTRSKYRSKSKSRGKTPPRRGRSRTKSKSRTPKKTKSASRSPSYHSIDSSKFISPNRLRAKRTRSKSWSLPHVASNKKRSWSKSPSPKKK